MPNIPDDRALAAAFERGRLWASTVDPDQVAEQVALGEAFFAGFEAALRARGGGGLSLHDEMTLGVGRWFLEGVVERAGLADVGRLVAA